jgi:large subunit ribosomal protein L13
MTTGNSAGLLGGSICPAAAAEGRENPIGGENDLFCGRNTAATGLDIGLSRPVRLSSTAPRCGELPRARLFHGRAGAEPASQASPMKTYVATPDSRQRDWWVVDADGKTLGRLATQIADVLRGKRKPEYTPHVDTGDFVVVINAAKVAVTGNKRADKVYYRHTGYPGGIRSRTLAEMLERQPEEVVRKAVKGMLPRNRLARQQLRKLKVYAGPEHPHQAQQPKPMEVRD